MRDPRLVGGLLLVQALALLALLGWWCSLTPAGRLGASGRSWRENTSRRCRQRGSWPR